MRSTLAFCGTLAILAAAGPDRVSRARRARVHRPHPAQLQSSLP